MSTAADLVIAAQSILVLGVFVASVTAYRRGLHDWSVFHAAVAGLCLVYLTGYGWLLFTDVGRATWSEVMVGVGFIAWPIAWGYPSIASIRSQAKIDRLRSTVVDYERSSPILDRCEEA